MPVKVETTTFGFGGLPRGLGVLVLVALWGVFGDAAAQPTPDIAAWTVSDSVVVGETFILNVTSSTPAHRAVGFPEASADSGRFGELTVLGRSRVHTRRVGAGYAIDSVAYTVRTSTSGTVRVPPIPVWVDAGVDTVVAHTHPRTVWVSSSTIETTASASDAPAETDMVFWGAWAAVVALLIGGGRFFWTHVGTADGSAVEAISPGTAESPTPFRAAVDRLDELQPPAAPSDAGDCCVECADIMRVYLADRLGVAAFTSTTGDLLRRLQAHPEVSQAAHRQIGEVLRRADLVKFAGARPEAETVERSLSAARTALSDIQQSRGSE